MVVHGGGLVTDPQDMAISDNTNQNCKIETLPHSAVPVGEFEFVWSKLTGCKWWPAITINGIDCGKSPAKFGFCWIFWFGDYKISEVPTLKILNFISCYQKMTEIKSSKSRHRAILETLEILCDVVGYSRKPNESLFTWAQNGFKREDAVTEYKFTGKDAFANSLPPLVINHLNHIKDEEQESSSDSDCESIPENFREKFLLENLKIEELCIACHGRSSEVVCEHPFFKGGMCLPCKESMKESAFAIGDDAKNFCCTICADGGSIVMCENLNCPKSYCKRCLKFYLGSEVVAEKILEVSPWLCFFCSKNENNNSILSIQDDWERKLTELFIPETAPCEIIPTFTLKKPVTVLSLFDGISTGKLVLDMLGIRVNKYYSCEIDEDAINVSKFHYVDSIIHLGDVCYINERVIEELDQIDLVIGGSPCNDLSLVNPARKGLYDFTGTGNLFFDFFHILHIVKRKNENVFFLFENVAAMQTKDRVTISTFLMKEPVLVDASHFSPQARPRYFWGNIPGLHSFTRYLNSIGNNNALSKFILPNLEREAVVNQIRTVTTQRNSLIQDQYTLMPVLMKGEPDLLWVTELEIIFGFPMHFTDAGNVSLTTRRELLGRAWSVPVIKAILQPLRSFFECD